MRYPEMTDAELVCAYRHGWTAKSYIGHGISNRAWDSRARLVEELRSRGIDPATLEPSKWGQHTDECPAPDRRCD